jgi:hypothetical protein
MNVDQIQNEATNVNSALLLDMKQYMIDKQAHNDKLQAQQMEQNARHENQMQLTNALMNQMMEMNLNIRNESMLQNNNINVQLANLAVKGKSHPKNAVELFAAATALIREAVTNKLPETTADLWENALAHYKIYGNYREAFEAEIVDPEVAKFASIAKLLNNGKEIQPATTRARAVKETVSMSTKKCNRCGRIGHMKSDCYATTNVEGDRF